MATSSRESRRRRIIDRGSDRLALITGRIQTIPPPLSPSESVEGSINVDDRSQPDVPQDQEILPSKSQNNEPSNGKGETLSSMSLKNSYGSESSVELTCLERVSSLVATGDPSSHVSDNEQSSLVMSTDRASSIRHSGADGPAERPAHWHEIFNPKPLNSAIAATEMTRVFCSVAVALLVVSSQLQFPLLGRNITGFFASSTPLCLVLLTNLSIVICQLVFDNQRGAERPSRAESKIPITDNSGWAQQMSSALELVLSMKVVIDAVLMVCSVYLVLVICGISFTQGFRKQVSIYFC